MGKVTEAVARFQSGRRLETQTFMLSRFGGLSKNARTRGSEMKKNIHQFTLILTDCSQVDEELENRVFKSGCDDALLAVRDSVVYLDFDRRAPTFHDALVSAIRDIESAGLKVARVEPDDLVNQSQIAERVGRTRESIRLFINGERGAGAFPPPVSGVKGNMRLWRWSQVAHWLVVHSLLEEREAKHAALIAELNAVLELRASARVTRPPKAVLDLLKTINPKPRAPRARRDAERT